METEKEYINTSDTKNEFNNIVKDISIKTIISMDEQIKDAQYVPKNDDENEDTMLEVKMVKVVSVELNKSMIKGVSGINYFRHLLKI